MVRFATKSRCVAAARQLGTFLASSVLFTSAGLALSAGRVRNAAASCERLYDEAGLQRGAVNLLFRPNAPDAAPSLLLSGAYPLKSGAEKVKMREMVGAAAVQDLFDVLLGGNGGDAFLLYASVKSLCDAAGRLAAGTGAVLGQKKCRKLLAPADRERLLSALVAGVGHISALGAGGEALQNDVAVLQLSSPSDPAWCTTVQTLQKTLSKVCAEAKAKAEAACGTLIRTLRGPYLEGYPPELARVVQSVLSVLERYSVDEQVAFFTVGQHALLPHSSYLIAERNGKTAGDEDPPAVQRGHVAANTYLKKEREVFGAGGAEAAQQAFPFVFNLSAPLHTIDRLAHTEVMFLYLFRAAEGADGTWLCWFLTYKDMCSSCRFFMQNRPDASEEAPLLVLSCAACGGDTDVRADAVWDEMGLQRLAVERADPSVVRVRVGAGIAGWLNVVVRDADRVDVTLESTPRDSSSPCCLQ